MSSRLFRQWLTPLCQTHGHRIFVHNPTRCSFRLTYRDFLQRFEKSNIFEKTNTPFSKYQLLESAHGNSLHLLFQIFHTWQQNRVACILPWYLPEKTKQHCRELIVNANTNFNKHEHDNDALVLFTSGTSGPPKGVRLSTDNIMSHLSQLRHHCHDGWLSHKDRSLSLLPWSHCYGLIAECFSIIDRGASLALLHSPKFRFMNWILSAQLYRPTVIFTVPHMLNTFQRIDQHYFSPLYPVSWRRSFFMGPSIRYIVSGGSALREETKQYIQDVLKIPIFQGYGCTEMSPMMSLENEADFLYTPPNKDMTFPLSKSYIPAHCLGTLLPHIETMFDPVTNELCVRGPTRFVGYLGQPNLDPNAWIKTGDLVSITENRHVFFHTRLSDTIKLSNGKFVSLCDIERQVRQNITHFHPHVQLCVWQRSDTKTLQGLIYHPEQHMCIPSKVTVYDHTHIDIHTLSHPFLSVDLGTMTMKGDVIRTAVDTFFHQHVLNMTKNGVPYSP